MSNEITVRLKCSITEIQDILKGKGFGIVDKYELEDTYYISKNIEINKLSRQEISKLYILIRNIKQYEPKRFIKSNNIIKLTYKYKNMNKMMILLVKKKN